MSGKPENKKDIRTLVRACLALGLVFVFFLLAAAGGTAKATGEKRRIHVVFDDSGTMQNEYRWSRAKYALEVFTAMLETDDELKVYALNSPETLELNGTDDKRVEQMHQWGASQKGGGTSFKMVETAANELIAMQDQYTDCWLVVLTDGGFDDVRQASQVEKIFDGWNDQGIKTVYMGIGREAKDIKSNPDKGAYSYKAVDSQGILRQLRDIANRIFNRLSLPSGHFQKNGDVYTLDIDIPTRDIIVFAQGDNVQIGDLLVDGTVKKPVETMSVQYTDPPKVYRTADKSLKGVVAVYDASPAAAISVEVSNCNEVEFYYDPGVEVDCELSQNGAVIPKDSEIMEGQYHVTGAFTDPATGQRVQSDLLDENAIVLTLDNNGTVYNFGISGGDVELKIGAVTVTATADLKTTILQTTKVYRVPDPPLPPDVIPVPEEYTYSVRRDQLQDNGTIKLLFTVVDADTRIPVGEEIWNDIRLEIPDQHGIHWEWTKDGTNCPCIRIVPSAAGKYADVEVGMFQFTGTILNHYDKQREFEFPFGGDSYEPLRVENKTIQVTTQALQNRTYTFVIHVLDPYSNDDPVTGVLWDHVKDLKVSEDHGIAWDCQRGPQEGEYTLTPASSDGKADSVNPGTYDFTVTAEYDDGGMAWNTEGTISVTVNQ